MALREPSIGRRTAAILPSSFDLRNTAKYIFSKLGWAYQGCSLPYRALIMGGPVGHGMGNGCISIPTGVDRFNCGRHNSTGVRLSSSPETVACLRWSLRIDAFFTTRKLTFQVYGECHCKAGKKPAF